MKKGKNRYSVPKQARENLAKHRQFAKERRLKRIFSAFFTPALCIVVGSLVLVYVFLDRDPYREIRQSVSVNGVFESIKYTEQFRGASYSTIKLIGSDEIYTISTISFKYPDYKEISDHVAPGTPIRLVVSDKQTHAGNRHVYAVSVGDREALSIEDTARSYEENNKFGLALGLIFMVLGVPSAIIILFIYFKTKHALQESD